MINFIEEEQLSINEKDRIKILASQMARLGLDNDITLKTLTQLEENKYKMTVKAVIEEGEEIIKEIDINWVQIETQTNRKKIDENKKSIAFSLTFIDENKTLTDNEVMEVFNKIIKEVTTKFNAEIRDK